MLGSVTEKPVLVRWMIRRDMAEVVAIEAASFEHAWTEDELLACLKRRNCIGLVAETGERILGFIIYELHAKHLNIVSLAIHPNHRRAGLGAILINRLKGKLTSQRYKRITALIRETNIAALNFFKAQQLRATRIVPLPFDETQEDGIEMQYVLTTPRSVS
jgi:[ribosomal protein S18]-alanine N-acetyltransferase